MIINLRVDYTIADIETMENVSKDIHAIFDRLQDKYDIDEYVEISTCNRNEFYIHNDCFDFDEPLLDNLNDNIIVEYAPSSYDFWFGINDCW